MALIFFGNEKNRFTLIFPPLADQVVSDLCDYVMANYRSKTAATLRDNLKLLNFKLETAEGIGTLMTLKKMIGTDFFGNEKNRFTLIFPPLADQVVSD